MLNMIHDRHQSTAEIAEIAEKNLGPFAYVVSGFSRTDALTVVVRLLSDGTAAR
jgi:hypothetical protein